MLFDNIKRYNLIEKISKKLNNTNHKILLEYIIEKINKDVKKKEMETYTLINTNDLNDDELQKIDDFVNLLILNQENK